MATQTPPLQEAPGAQSPLLLHELGQLAKVPLQTYAPHEGSPAAPAGRSVQVPEAPVRLQPSQAFPHALSQHTPSSQWLLWHCAARVQLAPLASLGTHAPPLHQCVETQPESSAHDVGQVPLLPSHTYGPQLGSPALLAASGVQMPSLPVTSHRSQAPPHALLQQ